MENLPAVVEGEASAYAKSEEDPEEPPLDSSELSLELRLHYRAVLPCEPGLGRALPAAKELRANRQPDHNEDDGYNNHKFSRHWGSFLSVLANPHVFWWRTYFVIHPLRFLSQRVYGLGEAAHPQEGSHCCPRSDKNADPCGGVSDAIDNLTDSVVIDVHQGDSEQQTCQRVLEKYSH